MLKAFAIFGGVCGTVVRTNSGAIRGLQKDGFEVFRGIPYAEPPVRFAAPVAKKPWNETRNGSVFGDACVGTPGMQPWAGLYGASEDCLYLNVWKPDNAENLPVLVFIHGGGFVAGTGNSPRYWGDSYARNPDKPLVYVTLNYRLGIFGFYSSEETGANAAIKDQQLALKWIQDNINFFGGDPKRITLAGQSAGAMSVYTHLVSPVSFGLFQRAFVASNVGLHYHTLEENRIFIKAVAHGLLCFGLFETELECLRDRRADELAVMGDAILADHLTSGCPKCVNFLPWVPTIDGLILKESPLVLIAAGQHVKVPVIFTNVRNESLAFQPWIVRSITNSWLGYNEVMEKMFYDNAHEAEIFYAKTPQTADLSYNLRVSAAITDLVFECFTRDLARTFSKSMPTFTSVFAHAPSENADPHNKKIDRLCVTGATCHGSDLAWLIPASDEMARLYGVHYTLPEKKLAARYSGAVNNFVYGSNSDWRLYNAERDVTSWWETYETNGKAHYREAYCDFLVNRVEPQHHFWHSSKPVTMV